MTTLFFCNLKPDKTGAFERVLADLGRVHHSHDDRCVLAIASEPMTEVADWFRKAGIDWHVIPGWGSERVRPWAFIMPALHLLRLERPDVAVVHFGNELPSLMLSLLAPLFGVRGVRWVWQQDQQMVPPGVVTRWVSRIRLLGLRFNHFVAVYEGGRAAMVARGISADRISVVHNGVMDPEPEKNRDQVRREVVSGQWAESQVNMDRQDIQDKGNESRSSESSCKSCASMLNPSLDTKDQELLLMNVGSLIPRKRQAFLVAVFADLIREIKVPELRLLLIGEGPDRAQLENQVKALGLQDRVTFPGKRNDVARLLCGADVFVHAAVAEGCAYALSEAMAAGVPLVVTEAGAAREQVSEGVNGFVVGPEDRAMFKERLGELIRNMPLRERMGVASRGRWAKGFRVEDQARAYWEIYKRVAIGRNDYV
jgi:glycosyltransferase involved in cell wall biosynthesis